MITILMLVPLLICIAVCAGTVYLFLKAKPLALRYDGYIARRSSQQNVTRSAETVAKNISFMTIFVRVAAALVFFPASGMTLVLLIMVINR